MMYCKEGYKKLFGDPDQKKKKDETVRLGRHTVHAVGRSAGYNAIPSVLLGRWGGNCVAVIAAEEDYRRIEGTGEVQGGVEVALTRGAFAEIAQLNGGLIE
jgi:hypothetical protein